MTDWLTFISIFLCLSILVFGGSAAIIAYMRANGTDYDLWECPSCRAEFRAKGNVTECPYCCPSGQHTQGQGWSGIPYNPFYGNDVEQYFTDEFDDDLPGKPGYERV